MKKFILLVFLLLLMVAVCSRCKHLRDQDDPSNDCYYDGSVEGLKEWYYYKVGTYWIYEDVNSGIRDTLTVLTNAESPQGVDYASCEFKAFSTYYNGFINVYFNDSYTIHCLNHQSCDCRKIRWGFNSTATGVSGGGWYFLYPHIPNNYNNIAGTGTTTLQSFNQEMVVQDSLYRQVVIYDVTNSFIEGPQNGWQSGTQVYFTIAKNHFIIRKQVPEYNQDWQLIEHVIIQ
jgi:hypothetical protein